MRYKGIIFDLDGVICTTDEYHYQAWKSLADERGIYFDREINNRLRGISRMESLDIILERFDGKVTDDEKIRMSNSKNEQYVRFLQNMSPDDLSDEVKQTLVYLKEKGYKLAIGSSSKNAKFILKQLGLGNFFEVVSDGTNITKSKPDPEVFLMAAHNLDLEPNSCLVVEDAYAGIDAAVSGGFDCAGIGEAAAYEKATYSLNCFRDLEKI